MDGRSEGIRGKLASRVVMIETDRGLVRSARCRRTENAAEPVLPRLARARTAGASDGGAPDRGDGLRRAMSATSSLDDFPEAMIHVTGAERSAAEAQRSWLDRQRFRPEQWSSRERWRACAVVRGGAVSDLEGLPPEILLGHTRGHAGVVARARSLDARRRRRVLRSTRARADAALPLGPAVRGSTISAGCASSPRELRTRSRSAARTIRTSSSAISVVHR